VKSLDRSAPEDEPTPELGDRGAAEERQGQLELLAEDGEGTLHAGLAARVGSPSAQRAVGRANGMNRLAIVIPCHRVVNSDGKLGGYGGGLWRKHWLLGLESGGSAAR